MAIGVFDSNNSCGKLQHKSFGEKEERVSSSLAWPSAPLKERLKQKRRGPAFVKTSKSPSIWQKAELEASFVPQDSCVSCAQENLSLCFHFSGLNGMHFPLRVSFYFKRMQLLVHKLSLSLPEPMF